jgi:hypothetical protein
MSSAGALNPYALASARTLQDGVYKTENGTWRINAYIGEIPAFSAFTIMAYSIVLLKRLYLGQWLVGYMCDQKLFELLTPPRNW